jgi:hypothetical protein
MAARGPEAESFILSPLYCGAKGVGYAATEDARSHDGLGPNLRLGWAMAVSGAARGAPGRFEPPGPITALLTLFKARHGSWIERPKPVGWNGASPRVGDVPLSAFLGLTDGGGEFLHLTGGGDFERLGVYELIRRRCLYIVAVDAAGDGDSPEAGLAALIGRCRIDFGIRIQIDTGPLRRQGPDGLSRTHVAVGQIHYGDVDPGAMPGLLVFVIASMTGDEPPDVQQHARKEAGFPHRADARWHGLDEESFECSRCLGEHIAHAVFSEAVERLPAQSSVPEPTRQAHAEFVPRLFAAVQERWAEPGDGQAALRRAASRLHRPDGTGTVPGVSPPSWEPAPRRDADIASSEG